MPDDKARETTEERDLRTGPRREIKPDMRLLIRLIAGTTLAGGFAPMIRTFTS